MTSRWFVPQIILVITLQVTVLGLNSVQAPLMCKEAFGEQCFSIEGYFRTMSTVAGILASPVAGLFMDWFGPRNTLSWAMCVGALPAVVPACL